MGSLKSAGIEAIGQDNVCLVVCRLFMLILERRNQIIVRKASKATG